MTAAILSLFLAIGASSAWSTPSLPDLREIKADYVSGPLEQPILEHSGWIKKGSITEYRGAGDLIANTVSVMTENSFGAGFVLDAQSVRNLLPDLGEDHIRKYTFIITNFHVVESGMVPTVLYAPKGNIDLDNCEAAVARILSTLPEKDLALLMVDARPPHVKGATYDPIAGVGVGDDVEAVGHPSGEFWTYTRGYVSQVRKGYEWQYNESFTLKADVIQTQTPISTGNSGGPLFARNGNVVGINSFVSESGQNLNFAVAASEFEQLRSAVSDAVEKSPLKSSFGWTEIDDTFSANYEMIEDGKHEELFYKVFEGRDDSFTFMAFYEDKSSEPIIIFYAPVGEAEFGFLLETDHSNPNAIFMVTVSDEEDNDVLVGWDFDGDFVLDYAF